MLNLSCRLFRLVSIPDPDIACHHGGNNGTTVIANAPAGSQVIFQWAYVMSCPL